MAEMNNQFTMELPDGWEDRTAYTFMGQEENGVQHLVTLTIDRKIQDDNLKFYARDRIDILANTLQGMEILKEEERTLENGMRVFEMACKWVPLDGKLLFQRHYYMIIDRVGYIFSGTFSKQSMKTIGVDVERMISSFKPMIPETLG